MCQSSKPSGLSVHQKQSSRFPISLFILLAICLFGRPSEAKYGGGTGEPNDPYIIYTAEQMNAIGADSNDWDKHFKLMADIDLSHYTGSPRRPIFNIIGRYGDPFSGVFDGNGKKITNFTYSSAETDHVGLFGYVVGSDTQIKDLTLINPNIDAESVDYVGSLVGLFIGEKITNCYVLDGTVTGKKYVGGLVGWNYWSSIINCYATGSVTGNTDVGGLVGYNGTGTVSNCYSTVSVSGNYQVGGLVGYNDLACIVSNCYAGSTVVGKSEVGGLVGNNAGTISNCYATGDISGNDYAGGLVGFFYGTITSSYSVGSVSSSGFLQETVGGLVGDNYGGRVYCSFWDTQTSGQPWSAGGTGKTTAEMQMASTFIGWGCDPVWTLDEGVDYPRLWWENMPGETITTPSFLSMAGSGTEENPYLVHTPEELNAIGLFPCEWSKHFKLMANIDLGSYTEEQFNITGVNYQNAFTGGFDGNRHTVSNFSYTTSRHRIYIGFFGYIRGQNVEIKDLGLIDPNVNAGRGSHVGSLVGHLIDGKITNCYIQGGTVAGDRSVGSLVGENYYGTITNCYSGGDVSGTSWVGGLVGENTRGTITNCYATASISAPAWGQIGGLVGMDINGTIENCFWDTETSGQTTSAGGEGKTTTEMKNATTFLNAGWDFVAESENGTEDTWCICQGVDYPKLRWQFIIGDFDGDNDTDFADFCLFAAHWLGTDSNFFCGDGSTDLTNDDRIDSNDLKEFTENWLAGVE